MLGLCARVVGYDSELAVYRDWGWELAVSRGWALVLCRSCDLAMCRDCRLIVCRDLG